MMIQKKMNKQIFLIFLLGIFLFTIPLVRAAEKEGKLTEMATLTITNVESGDTLSAYKILDIYKNDTTNEITYGFTTQFRSFLNDSETYQDLTEEEYQKLTSGDITSGSTKTNSTLDTLASAYASYIKRNNIEGTDMTTTTDMATKELEVGTYLILPKVTKRVYAVMVGNLDYKEQNGTWQKQDAIINAKVSDALLTKTIGSTTHTDQSFLMDREYAYTITATIPAYPTNATNKTYIIKDTFSEGITFMNIEDLIIKDGEAVYQATREGKVQDGSGNTIASITYTKPNLTITFDVAYITSNKLIIEYKAKLNQSAQLGKLGNQNSAQLVYSNDPYGTNVVETEAVVATAYTYGLKLLKYDESDEKKGLKGAVFEIYSDSNLTTKIGSMTTKEDGTAEYKGLKEGTYYLKEVTAPAGYTLLKQNIEVQINAEQIESDEESNGYQTIEIGNQKAGLLPFTGGLGTIIYTLLGLSIVAIAATSITMYQKKLRVK